MCLVSVQNSAEIQRNYKDVVDYAKCMMYVMQMMQLLIEQSGKLFWLRQEAQEVPLSVCVSVCDICDLWILQSVKAGIISSFWSLILNFFHYKCNLKRAEVIHYLCSKSSKKFPFYFYMLRALDTDCCASFTMLFIHSLYLWFWLSPRILCFYPDFNVC